MANRSFPNIPVPVFELYGDWNSAKKVPLRVQRLLSKSYEEWSNKYARKLLKELRSYIGTGRVPPNTYWEPLKYRGKISPSSFYKNTGLLKRSLGIRLSRSGYVQVGLLNPRQRHPHGRISLSAILSILQAGTSDGAIPSRPLFNPVFQSLGGTPGMKKDLIKYIHRKCKTDPFINKCEVKIVKYL